MIRIASARKPKRQLKIRSIIGHKRKTVQVTYFALREQKTKPSINILN